MIQPESTANPSQSVDMSIIKAAQAWVLSLFNDSHDTRLLYHNYRHSAAVVDKVNEIAQSGGFSSETIEIAQIAAWFYGTGYLKDYLSFHNQSIIAAEEFLNERKYPSKKKSKVLSCINALKLGHEPETIEQQLFADAQTAVELTDQFFQLGPLLHLERELVLNQPLSASEWAQVQLQSLLKTKFYTDYAKKVFEPIVAQNILTQKTIVEKTKRADLKREALGDGLLRKFQNIEKNIPTRATQTFFRINYRNHINLSSIADNKAHIMISVNAIIISVLISILSYRNITESNPLVLMPVIIFLVTGLTSLVYAVLSARPKITTLNVGKNTLEETKKNIIFFGNFVHLDLDQYEAAMDSVFRDGELLYGNMTRDLYYLGKVLDKKYRYLTYSYNIFMVGFAATVLTFLLAFLS
ncbi:MAG TPA: hypothetical protein ENK52_05220 [Saprospiraceae bacterium]|nr:hypothetical protein [Saprospiraceae bacterium]